LNFNLSETPLVKYKNYWLKREDLSPTGSHKFRSLLYQLAKLRENNITTAVLSSSGNAAISAAKYAQTAGVKIFILLSKKTAPAKLSALSKQLNKNVIPILSTRPLRLAKYFAAKYKIPDLRPSKDPNAALGFRSLGLEIFQQNPQTQNIFSFFTSGASLQGIFATYNELLQSKQIKKIPRLFGVYSSHSLAKNQIEKVAKICKKSKGKIIEISNAEIYTIRQKFLNTSNEGIANFCAAEKIQPIGTTVIILTGKNWSKQNFDANNFLFAENFAEIDKIAKTQNLEIPQ
jgi:threonine synthase